jgi:hypothetical protein
MNHHLKYIILLMFSFSSIWAETDMHQIIYWQCSSSDNANNQWTSKSANKRAALNISFEACKKESEIPTTCKSSDSCDGINRLGTITKPKVNCTAFDRLGQAWVSYVNTQGEDAAMAAKDYCQKNSVLPYTCYVNLVTCANSYEGE